MGMVKREEAAAAAEVAARTAGVSKVVKVFEYMD
jgi:osmotically-inducible protein OsmY